jgi:hypothetical protein
MTRNTDAKVCPSRTAPKFVIRVPQDLKDAITELGMHHNRSVNSEMVQAIQCWQSCKGQLELLKSVLSSRMEPAQAVLALSVPHMVPQLPQTKFVVRLLPGMRDKISDEKDERVAASARDKSVKRCAMNDIVNEILQWWMNINQDLKALMAACNKHNGSPKDILDVSVFMTNVA